LGPIALLFAEDPNLYRVEPYAYIDGQKHETNLLPVFGDGRVHEVRVVLG